MTDPRLSVRDRAAGPSTEKVVEALDRLRPVVRVGDGLHPTAAAAVGGLYSMLVRVHPHTILEGDALMGPNPWGVDTLADLPDHLVPCRPAPVTSPAKDIVIGAGPDVGGAELWLGGDDWTALAGHHPAPLTPDEHAFGVHAAAALTAAEVMKRVLGPLGMMNVPMTEPLVWNLLDYRLAAAGSIPTPIHQTLDVVLFGAGSVGSSTAGLLVCDPGTSGTIVVVDPDSFDPVRNPYRYPASTGTERGPKADWVAGLLSKAGWRAPGCCQRVADWTRSQETPGWAGIAVSSVDRVDGRLDVADVLAHTTVSVGVAGLALHAQVEHCFDEFACPYCDFAGEAAPMTRIQARAQQVGLSPARVAQLDLDGRVLEPDDVAAAVAAGRVRAEQADQLVGRRLDDLIRRVYAEATVPAAGEEPAAVTSPYVSWMGGLLAAAELAKAARGLLPLDRRVDLDLSGVPLGVQSRRPRNQAGTCICSSPKRRAWAGRLYGQDGRRQ